MRSTNIALRVPADLYDALKLEADALGSSLNGYIVEMLARRDHARRELHAARDANSARFAAVIAHQTPAPALVITPEAKPSLRAPGRATEADTASSPAKPGRRKAAVFNDQGQRLCQGPCGQFKDLDQFTKGKAVCKVCRSAEQGLKNKAARGTL